MVWTFRVWIGRLHLVQGREIAYHSSCNGSSQACRPFALAPGSSPTSAAQLHAGLSCAARRLLGQGAKCRAPGLSSAEARARVLVVNLEVNPRSAITSLRAWMRQGGPCKTVRRVKGKNLTRVLCTCLAHGKYSVVGRAQVMAADCPSTNPSSTAYWLCDLGHLTKPAWASGFLSDGSNEHLPTLCGCGEG